MTVYHFGEPWDAPAVDGATQVPTPVGQVCSLCPDLIEAEDRGFLRGHLGADGKGGMGPVHVGCEAYVVTGHSVGVCTCTGYPPSRAAGLLVLERLRVRPSRVGPAGPDVHRT